MERIVLAYDLLKEFSNKGKLKDLYYYAKTVKITAGRGFCKKSELISKLGVSKPAAYQWIKTMISQGMISMKNDVIYVIGKKRFSRIHGVRSKVHIKFFDLSTFKAFRNHFLVQGGIICQNRFKFNHKLLMKNLGCPLQVERIQYPISASKSKVGCSLSYLSKKTGYSKSVVSKALKGNTKANWEFIKKVSKQEIALLTRYNFFNDHPMVRYNIQNLYYRLPNSIISGAEICRRRL